MFSWSEPDLVHNRSVEKTGNLWNTRATPVTAPTRGELSGAAHPTSHVPGLSRHRGTPADRAASGKGAGAVYPNRVSTFRVICSTCGSRWASPCAQSVDPDVTTVAPASLVYAPSTAWP